MNNNNNTKLVEQSSQFLEKINATVNQFKSALDDYKKYYVYYNKNPENNEFQNYYANSVNQLKTTSQTLVTTTGQIYSDVDKTNKSIDPIATQLEKEKSLNKKLTKMLSNLEHTQNGTEILIDDSKNAYNTQYYYNWEIIIGILMVGSLLSKLFRPNVTQ